MRRKKQSIKLQYRFAIAGILLTIGFITGTLVDPNNVRNIILLFNSETPSTSRDHDAILIGTSEINLCFTPPSKCSLFIAEHILAAKESIYLQAYGITSDKIVDELIKAHKRGVKVKALLDKSNVNSKYSKMKQMLDSGIEVSIDRVPGIAHNKIMIIDKSKVITGSFNFTKNADTRNTENVIIVNNEELATRYLQNWLFRKSIIDQSVPAS